jgi:Protein of unknown function (DUF4013)
MDVGQISSNAIKYPFSGFSKIIILGIFLILSFLIIPGFIYLGYIFKTLKASVNGLDELPEFGEWSEMFIDGLKVFIVLLIYTIVPLTLIIVGIWASLIPIIVSYNTGLAELSTISFGLISSLSIIGGILGIIISFFIPVILTNIAYYGELKYAFKFNELFQKMSEIGWVDYLIWYIVMLIIWTVTATVAFFMIFPLIIGVLLVPLVIYPYMMLFFARSTALVYLYGGADDYLKSSL